MFLTHIHASLMYPTTFQAAATSDLDNIMQFLISGKGPGINILVEIIIDTHLDINCDDFEFYVKLGV